MTTILPPCQQNPTPASSCKTLACGESCTPDCSSARQAHRKARNAPSFCVVRCCELAGRMAGVEVPTLHPSSNPILIFTQTKVHHNRPWKSKKHKLHYFSTQARHTSHTGFHTVYMRATNYYYGGFFKHSLCSGNTSGRKLKKTQSIGQGHCSTTGTDWLTLITKHST
jgi:hypothetical protein